ncbi:MAG: GntR family transcriptional regulator [Sulfitobacter sp.]
MNESTADTAPLSQLLPQGLRSGDAEMTLFEGGPAARGVYDKLRDQIVRLELPPGTPLLRSELAATYGVSLTPLRDALQQLAKEGLVRIFPQSRTLVTQINTDAIRGAQFMRIALETEVVRQLAGQIAPEHLARLRSIVALQIGVGNQPSDIAMFQELDELFHQGLFAAAGHMQSQRLMRAQAGDLERLRRLHLTQKADPQSDTGLLNTDAVTEGHRQILDGIEAGDAAVATDALRRHLQRTVNRIAEKRAAFPGYFEPEKG